MKKFGILSISALLMCACSSTEINELDPSNQETALLSISTSVLTQNTKAGVTRTTNGADGADKGPVMGTALAADSEIGVYVYKNNTFESYVGSTASENPINIKWTLNETAWTTESNLAFNSDKGDVYAYFPYVSGTTTTTNGVLSGTINPGYTDYLYGSHKGLDAHNPKAAITLNHAMAMVAFTFAKGEQYSGPCSLTNITLNDLPQNGSLSLQNGITASEAKGGGSVILKKYESTNYSLTFTTDFSDGTKEVPIGDYIKDQTPMFHALVLPQNNGFKTKETEGTYASITIDGVTYSVSLAPTGGKLEGNKVYTYNLTMKGSNNLVVETISVTQWGEAVSTNIEI